MSPRGIEKEGLSRRTLRCYGGGGNRCRIFRSFHFLPPLLFWPSRAAFVVCRDVSLFPFGRRRRRGEEASPVLRMLSGKKIFRPPPLISLQETRAAAAAAARRRRVRPGTTNAKQNNIARPTFLSGKNLWPIASETFLSPIYYSNFREIFIKTCLQYFCFLRLCGN